jgi:pyruvate/2-oxoglutarate dehydrogenase complex dihydrolipoamide acyltransferase (E2) component
MATALRMPRLSKGMTTGEVMEWRKSPGEPVEAGEPLLIVMSEKAEVEVEAPAAGVLLATLVASGEEAPVGAVLAWIGQPGQAFGAAEPAEEPPVVASDVPVAPEAALRSAAAATAAKPALAGWNQSAQADFATVAATSSRQIGYQTDLPTRVRASPAARRVAAEAGIALADIAGSGPGGLITESDVRQAIQDQPQSANLPIYQPDIERVPLRGVRKVMARRMALSASTTAAVTTVVDVDMAAVRDLRARLPITYTSAVVKAAALALQEHAILNAFLDATRNEILYHKRIHVGVAVDASQGLVVVVAPDADKKSLREIDDLLRRLSAVAKADRLDPETMASPTFTVTNSGVLGSLLFTPIINPPQSATLGMGKVQEMAVVRDGQIVARPVMYLCLTYDHRLIEGAEAVGFLQTVKRLLEAPETLA